VINQQVLALEADIIPTGLSNAIKWAGIDECVAAGFRGPATQLQN